MSHAAVVVPVHRPQPDAYEQISLRQCARVFARRAVVFVASERLDLGAYRAIVPSAAVVRVDAWWMASRRAYNRLMISPHFFTRFSRYTHVLVHEPDAIAFDDQLDAWCARPWDYIGAPWFEGFGRATPEARLAGVGNFGFSLHRVAAARRVLRSWRRWYPLDRLRDDLARGLRGDRLHLARGLRALSGAALARGAWRIADMNCDGFWAGLVPRLFPDYRVADLDDALRFSWEALPSRCQTLSGLAHPFGAHAWWRFDLPYLIALLERHGVDLSGLPEADRAAGRRLPAR